jgi:hypothetical protein
LDNTEIIDAYVPENTNIYAHNSTPMTLSNTLKDTQMSSSNEQFNGNNAISLEEEEHGDLGIFLLPMQLIVRFDSKAKKKRRIPVL